jgi:hypothetical protein
LRGVLRLAIPALRRDQLEALVVEVFVELIAVVGLVTPRPLMRCGVSSVSMNSNMPCTSLDSCGAALDAAAAEAGSYVGFSEREMIEK